MASHYAKQSPLTLTHFILSTTRAKFPEATGEFAILMNAIESASKFISSKVRAAGIMNLQGEEGSVNVQGETVKKLDVLSNDAMIEFLRRSTVVSLMVSEENETEITVPEYPNAKYCVAFDPLDGSSNIDVNITIGTIFTIFRKTGEADQPATVKDILQTGRNVVASGYVMYGSATVLVMASQGIDGVNGFTLDPSTGEFVLTQQDIKTKDFHKIYSVNQGNWKYFNDPTKKYIESCLNPEEGNPFSLRYIGSMIGDVHRTLLYGGIFMYPGDSRAPRGKLRLLYEVMPMAFIVHKAGGSSTDGSQCVLDVVPQGIHERCPCFLGSKKNVEDVEKLFQADK
eukprot:CAMPEP_0201520930 /NCGR_PEP_ID=MMETSP0161_2-20130828/13398_1 /ASSEMBLY_ACC=CAM_ASM_000251 /TAXON_ID=180227 /ORGANISM="Neoparamoeba aestuarina, Strain SoJaBio B1-5/56/2" /LENGTH=340 /DNA_ID=CAMNT_0047919459 /DNA_START=39 /DNA_END=1061 /DNA_ORIENTATION=+